MQNSKLSEIVAIEILSNLSKWNAFEISDMREVCKSKGIDFQIVFQIMRPYIDRVECGEEGEYYCLNAEGCKYVKSLRNANNKNDVEQKTMNKNTGDTEKGRVFIAHWIDDPFKSEVARLIEKLGFKAVLQEELAGEGKTIITQIIDELDKSCYGVVIYTYSDVGRRKDESDDKLRPRARQNVILEHGMLISKLGLSKVCCLVTEGIEHPSDTMGYCMLTSKKKIGDSTLRKT